MSLLIQEARYRKKEQASCIIIFIHGIAEGPAQFNELFEISFSCGYSVATLLLPGHGGSGKEFADSSKDLWIGHVISEIASYRKLYSEIILVGHSMGALLALLAYEHTSSQIKSIVALNAPLFVFVKPMAIRNNLKIGLCKNINEDDPAMAVLQASSIGACSVVTYIKWLPRIFDLFRIMNQARKLLYNIGVPIMVVHADKDELVSSRSVYLFKKRISTKLLNIVHLPESTHFVSEKRDLLSLHKKYIDFILNN